MEVNNIRELGIKIVREIEKETGVITSDSYLLAGMVAVYLGRYKETLKEHEHLIYK